MAILNGLIRKMTGSAGDFTFKTVSGRTVVSEKISSTTNRRTSAQQKQRMKWANVIQMYKGISPLLSYGFENKAQGVSDYNMFVKLNNAVSPVYLTKDEVAGGACIAAPYQITQGTLPSIVISGTGNGRYTDISLGSLSIDSTTTIAQFSNAIVENNSDYEYGDQIAYFLVKQLINETTQVPYCQFSACAVILDKDSSVKLLDQVMESGFATVSGKLGHGTQDEGDCVFGWVHSRKDSSKTKVSTQFLLDNNSVLADYTDEDAYTRAVNTYGGENSVFLTPDGSDTTVGNQNSGGSSLNPQLYTLNLSSSPAGGGTVTGAGSYAAGSTANISASANSGYSFSRWSDGDTNASRSVTVNSDLDLTAVFTTTSGDEDDENIPLFQ